MPPPPMEHEPPPLVERAEIADVDVQKMVDGLNESTQDETSGASQMELNGVKFKLEAAPFPGYVIAEISQADGTVKSVVLSKNDSSGENVWKKTTMDPEVVRQMPARGSPGEKVAAK